MLTLYQIRFKPICLFINLQAHSESLKTVTKRPKEDTGKFRADLSHSKADSRSESGTVRPRDDNLSKSSSPRSKDGSSKLSARSSGESTSEAGRVTNGKSRRKKEEPKSRSELSSQSSPGSIGKGIRSRSKEKSRTQVASGDSRSGSGSAIGGVGPRNIRSGSGSASSSDRSISSKKRLSKSDHERQNAIRNSVSDSTRHEACKEKSALTLDEIATQKLSKFKRIIRHPPPQFQLNGCKQYEDINLQRSETGQSDDENMDNMIERRQLCPTGFMTHLADCDCNGLRNNNVCLCNPSVCLNEDPSAKPNLCFCANSYMKGSDGHAYHTRCNCFDSK